MLERFVKPVVFAVSAVWSLAALAPNAWAEGEHDPSRAALGAVLAQERIVLTQLGSNRAKRLAGVKPKLARFLNIATANDPLGKRRPRKRVERVTTIEEVRAMPKATGGEQWSCMTEALYFEARGESFKAISAVAEVILNRVKSHRFPSTICDVIKQGEGGRPGCQFSYRCDGKPERYTEPRAYEKVAKIAKLAMEGKLAPVTYGALFYHAGSVNPSWSRAFQRTAAVGGHYFYRPG